MLSVLKYPWLIGVHSLSGLRLPSRQLLTSREEADKGGAAKGRLQVLPSFFLIIAFSHLKKTLMRG